jgi:hypothetical protein
MVLGAVLGVMLALPLSVVWEWDSGAIATAEAAGAMGETAGGSAGGKPQEPDVRGREGQGGQGSSMEDKVLRGGKDMTTAEEDDDSDRPPWAQIPGRDGKPGSGGGKPAEAGTMKGDLYGEMVIVLRDVNGVPILTQWTDSDGDGVNDTMVVCVADCGEGWFEQPLDAAGNPVPLDAEGEPYDATLLVEVDLGRLSVARSPSKVIEHALDEAISSLNVATSITVDAAGRLVLVIDGEVKTIDSPLENLALYETLISEGYLPGLTASDEVLGDLAYLKDPTYTSGDFASAASFLAAASDKFGATDLDEVVYINAILGIEGTLPDGYVDYSTYVYDRSDTYDGLTVTYLRDNGDGTYTEVTEPLMTAVFDSTDYDGVNVEGFAQAVDDATQVIEFVHEPIH